MVGEKVALTVAVKAVLTVVLKVGEMAACLAALKAENCAPPCSRSTSSFVPPARAA